MSESLSYDEYVHCIRTKSHAWSVVQVAKEFQQYPHVEIHEWAQEYSHNGLWYTSGSAAVFENSDDAVIFKLKFG